MKPSDIRKLAHSAWSALPYLQGKSFSDGREYLQGIYETEEKAHRKCAPDGMRHATTVRDAARVLAVSDIAGALLGIDELCEWRFILERRESWLYARAFVEVNRAEILGAWKAFDMTQLEALNYAEFVNADTE
jgi:hypothetical protein